MEIRKLLEDILIASIAVLIWAFGVYAIVYFFPSTSWLWYVFSVYAVISYAGAITDYTLSRAIGWLLNNKM